MTFFAVESSRFSHIDNNISADFSWLFPFCQKKKNNSIPIQFFVRIHIYNNFCCFSRKFLIRSLYIYIYFVERQEKFEFKTVALIYLFTCLNIVDQRKNIERAKCVCVIRSSKFLFDTVKTEKNVFLFRMIFLFDLRLSLGLDNVFHVPYYIWFILLRTLSLRNYLGNWYLFVFFFYFVRCAVTKSVSI